jgi:hypothetical protein
MVDLGAHMDELRIAAGRVEALAAVSVETYDNAIWEDADPVIVERIAHLLGATHEAAAAAVEAVDHFRTVVADAQPTEGGDQWGGVATASGE